MKSPFERKYGVLILLSVQTFKNPKPALMAALRESGPVPGDENGIKHKRPAGGEESAKKKKRTDKNVSLYDMGMRLGCRTDALSRSTWTSLPMGFRS